MKTATPRNIFETCLPCHHAQAISKVAYLRVYVNTVVVHRYRIGSGGDHHRNVLILPREPSPQDHGGIQVVLATTRQRHSRWSFD